MYDNSPGLLVPLSLSVVSESVLKSRLLFLVEDLDLGGPVGRIGVLFKPPAILLLEDDLEAPIERRNSARFDVDSTGYLEGLVVRSLDLPRGVQALSLILESSLAPSVFISISLNRSSKFGDNFSCIIYS